MRTLAVLRDVAAIAALGILSLVLWDVHTGLVSTTSQLRATLLDVSRLTQDATGVTGEIRKTLKASQDSSRQVALNSAAATKQAAAAVASLDTLVRHTDDQVNGHLLPLLESTISTQNTNFTGVSRELEASLGQLEQREEQLDPVLKNAAQATANLARVSADPSIPETLAHLDSASAGMADTAKSAADASRDLAEAIHRETRPASFTVKVAGWIVDGVSKAASVLAGFVK